LFTAQTASLIDLTMDAATLAAAPSSITAYPFQFVFKASGSLFISPVLIVSRMEYVNYPHSMFHIHIYGHQLKIFRDFIIIVDLVCLIVTHFYHI
jgi:hypothetical protein